MKAVNVPTATELLKTLQYMTSLKLVKYRAKWSKSSEDHIARLEKDYDDADKLLAYFTKR